MMRRLAKILLGVGLGLALLVGLLLWQAPRLLGPRRVLEYRPLTPEVAVDVAKRLRIVGLNLLLGRPATLTLSQDEFNRYLNQGVAHTPAITALSGQLQAEEVQMVAHTLIPGDFVIPTLRGKTVETLFTANVSVRSDQLILRLRELSVGVIPVPVGTFLRLAPQAGLPATFDPAEQTVAVSIHTLLQAAGGAAYADLPVVVDRVTIAPNAFTIQISTRK